MSNGDTPIPPLHTTIEVTDKLPRDYKEEARLYAEGLKDAGFWETFWATRTPSLFESWSWVLTWGSTKLKEALVQITKLLNAAESENAPETAELAAVFIEGVLKAKVDVAELTKMFQKGGAEAAFETIGKAIYDGLIELLIKQETLTPSNGLASAHRFLGYLTNWSIKEGIQKFIIGNLRMDWMGEFDGLADELFDKLGLQRHARAALRPLFDITLATPLEWNLNQQYRPKLLTAGEAVRAHIRGDLARA
ncbi:MAG: hypothetical protein L0Z53_15510, partial [Acidobacteriales bacterium]|nr:hypothetical protein [Terriglobales bacterium]